MIADVSSPLPDDAALARVLSAMLAEQGHDGGNVSVIDRQPSIQGTFPKEVVTCRIEGVGERQLFCKYEAGVEHNAHGHRGGVCYESLVYRYLLGSQQLVRPRLVGTHRDRRTDSTWLVLEYLDDCDRVKKSKDPEAMVLAARWIGKFHARNQHRTSSPEACFLSRFGRDYLVGWARRAVYWNSSTSAPAAWLTDLAERFEILADCLLESPSTIVHGEYYPNNIMYGDGCVYPVDWESAAISAGEIDVASLTEGWPDDVATECALEYARARWSEGPPAMYETRLQIARVYTQLRWLGDDEFGRYLAPGGWRLEHLRALVTAMDRTSD